MVHAAVPPEGVGLVGRVTHTSVFSPTPEPTPSRPYTLTPTHPHGRTATHTRTRPHPPLCQPGRRSPRPPDPSPPGPTCSAAHTASRREREWLVGLGWVGLGWQQRMSTESRGAEQVGALSCYPQPVPCPARLVGHPPTRLQLLPLFSSPPCNAPTCPLPPTQTHTHIYTYIYVCTRTAYQPCALVHRYTHRVPRNRTRRTTPRPAECIRATPAGAWHEATNTT